MVGAAVLPFKETSQHTLTCTLLTCTLAYLNTCTPLMLAHYYLHILVHTAACSLQTLLPEHCLLAAPNLLEHCSYCITQVVCYTVLHKWCFLTLSNTAQSTPHLLGHCSYCITEVVGAEVPFKDRRRAARGRNNGCKGGSNPPWNLKVTSGREVNPPWNFRGTP